MIGLTRTDTITFEEFIVRSSEARDAESLFGVLSKTVAGYGFDRVIFTVQRDLDLPADKQTHGVFHNYPEDWQKYYGEKSLWRLDPVYRAAATEDWAFRWTDLEKRSRYSAGQVKLMRLSEEAGLNGGIGVPIKGPRAQIAGVAVASSGARDASHIDIDLINAVCNQFYAAYKRLYAIKAPETDAAPLLSPKETEVLTWVAAGKTDEDVATILGISRNTVDAHMRHVFQKLGVNNRVAAVVKAIMNGMIQP
ncbi:LuxR family transcriptional regulator [Asticcacaulis sp. YBE204]|uniref:helix-turn-helix transcriptional regulator n=1 Tax=Asticcacaulis sp. YBE204 TaxID=1282363 RepID=UPI0003C3BDD6|nr:LuxR family transcriptional regulator [Asticcacaulis sp. YBE204]ESQ77942.1 hypothetical protein AEYBE204_15715 [Asticcacaulis sp. YBE204]